MFITTHFGRKASMFFIVLKADKMKFHKKSSKKAITFTGYVNE